MWSSSLIFLFLYWIALAKNGRGNKVDYYYFCSPKVDVYSTKCIS